MQKLPPSTAEIIRASVFLTLKKHKPTPLNITPSEKEALRSIKKRDNLVLLPADKHRDGKVHTFLEEGLRKFLARKIDYPFNRIKIRGPVSDDFWCFFIRQSNFLSWRDLTRLNSFIYDLLHKSIVHWKSTLERCYLSWLQSFLNQSVKCVCDSSHSLT